MTESYEECSSSALMSSSWSFVQSCTLMVGMGTVTQANPCECYNRILRLPHVHLNVDKFEHRCDVRVSISFTEHSIIR